MSCLDNALDAQLKKVIGIISSMGVDDSDNMDIYLRICKELAKRLKVNPSTDSKTVNKITQQATTSGKDSVSNSKTCAPQITETTTPAGLPSEKIVDKHVGTKKEAPVKQEAKSSKVENDKGELTAAQKKELTKLLQFQGNEAMNKAKETIGSWEIGLSSKRSESFLTTFLSSVTSKNNALLCRMADLCASIVKDNVVSSKTMTSKTLGSVLLEVFTISACKVKSLQTDIKKHAEANRDHDALVIFTKSILKNDVSVGIVCPIISLHFDEFFAGRADLVMFGVTLMLEVGHLLHGLFVDECFMNLLNVMNDTTVEAQSAITKLFLKRAEWIRTPGSCYLNLTLNFNSILGSLCVENLAVSIEECCLLLEKTTDEDLRQLTRVIGQNFIVKEQLVLDLCSGIAERKGTKTKWEKNFVTFLKSRMFETLEEDIRLVNKNEYQRVKSLAAMRVYVTFAIGAFVGGVTSMDTVKRSISLLLTSSDEEIICNGINMLRFVGNVVDEPTLDEWIAKLNSGKYTKKMRNNIAELIELRKTEWA